MRILFVITQGHAGGAQKYVLDLITGLSPTHEVFLAIGEDKENSFQRQIQAKNQKIVIFKLQHLKRNISPIHDLLGVLELHKLYKNIQPDIIHLNSSKAGVLGSLSKNKNTKIVYTVHGWVFLEPMSKAKKLLYHGLEYLSSHFQDATIILSQEEYHIAEKTLHIAKNKLSIIPLGIENIPFFNKPAARQKLCEENTRLNTNLFWTGTIANHYTSKGLDIFIEALSKLDQNTKSKFQSIIIGDGPERKKLEILIQKYQLENTCILLPFLPEASRFLKAFDLFVLPSRKEGLPYTLLESIQAQIPILATHVGGIPSLLQKYTQSILIEANNPDILKEKILFFLSNPQIFERFEKKEENPVSSLFSMIQNTESLYSKLLTAPLPEEDSNQT